MRGLTLIELLVIVVIILVLAALLFPVLTPDCPRPGRGARCVANLNQIGKAFQLYAVDNDQRLPPAGYSVSPSKSVSWHNLISIYLRDPDIWRCRVRHPESSNRPEPVVDYGYNARYLTTLAPDFSNWNDNSGISVESVEEPGSMVLAADSQASQPKGRCGEEATFLLPPSAADADCWGRPPLHERRPPLVAWLDERATSRPPAHWTAVVWLDGHVKAYRLEQFYTGQTPPDRFFDGKARWKRARNRRGAEPTEKPSRNSQRR